VFRQGYRSGNFVPKSTRKILAGWENGDVPDINVGDIVGNYALGYASLQVKCGGIICSPALSVCLASGVI